MTPRPAAATDVAAIAQTEAVAALHPWSEQQIRDSLARPVSVALVAGEPVVAHVLGTAVADEGEVLTVAVRPEARRRGLATALLHALEARWWKLGVRQAFLEVSAPNAGARALYARQGWREVGVRKRYYRDGSDAVLLSKEVTPC